MPVAINLFAQQFGWMLVVAKDKKRDRSGSLMWLCYCRRCGGKKIVSSDCLRRGESSSCGCYHREVARETHTRHGYYQHAIHTTWRGMRDRCFNERSKYFPRYGGRGVQVCAQWDRSFEAFLRDMGPTWFPGAQLHRKDNDGHYNRENAHWVSKAEHDRLHIAKLTPADLHVIRCCSSLSATKLAKLFAVSISTIGSVKRGQIPELPLWRSQYLEESE
jgi:hypothetical protein